MKKVIVIIAALAVVIGAYVLFEFTLSKAEISLNVESNYDSISGTVEITENDAIINLDESAIELYSDGALVASLSLDDAKSDFIFDNLDFDIEYEVRMNLIYKFKFYFSIYSIEESIEATTAFVSDWEVNVIEGGNPIPQGLIELQDRNILFYSSYYNQGVFSGLISKYTQSSELLWEKDIESEGITTVSGAFERDNGDILVSGIIVLDGRRLYYIMTIDENGETKSISYSKDWTDSSGSFYLNSSGIVEDANNGFAFTVDKGLDIYFVKLSSDFKIISEKKITGKTRIGNTIYGISHQLFPNGNGGYVLATSKVMDERRRDIHLFNLDCDGNVLWDNTYEVEGRGTANDIVVQDGKLIVVGDIWYNRDDEKSTNGRTSFEAFILKTDENGDMDWMVEVTDTEWDRYEDIEIDKNGNYLVSGVKGSNWNFEGSLWNINSHGEILFHVQLNNGYA